MINNDDIIAAFTAAGITDAAGLNAAVGGAVLLVSKLAAAGVSSPEAVETFVANAAKLITREALKALLLKAQSDAQAATLAANQVVANYQAQIAALDTQVTA
jgi:hypothetical protein